MYGILVHTTSYEYLENILKDKSLKPSSITNVESNNDYYGPNIFFQLITEEKELKSEKSIYGFGNVHFFLKPTIIEKYGKKKFIPTNYDIETMKYNSENKEFPMYKSWFNNAWLHGSFYKKNKEYKSVNYNPKKSLQENIKIFYNESKDIPVNELVIRSKSIPLKSNLLIIFIKDSNEVVDKYIKKYPMYNFTNNRNVLEKGLKSYFKHYNI